MNSKIITFSALALPAFSVQLQAQAKAPSQPNILCIVCEDISPFLGCYGDKVANTPNLDRLAAEGIRFDRMYTTVGVSSPSRAALITGMYPTAIGANNMRNLTGPEHMPDGILPYEVVPPEGVRCYTEFLREAGYYCTNNSKTDYQFKAPVTAWDENGEKAHWKNKPDGKPFFAIFNLGVTHESQIWGRADKPLTTQPDEIILPPYYPDNDVVRKDMAIMYSNIHEMDKQVQSLINEVRGAGLLDNTIIIWYSDNGGPLPRGKRELYETGTNIPFIIRFPDESYSSSVNQDLCMFVDIPPTMLSLAGVKPPAYMHGQAFWGKYASSHPRQYVYGARNRMDKSMEKQGAVRDKKYRYIRNYMPERSDFLNNTYQLNIPMTRNMLELYQQGKLNDAQRKWFELNRSREEFYDLEKDPYELNNLIGDHTYKEEIDRFRKAYESWDEKYNALWKLDEKDLRKKMWPNDLQPLVSDPVILKEKTKITIQTTTPGSSIAYQVNGKGYSLGHWFLYTGPFQINPGEIVTAKATRIGYRDSHPVSSDGKYELVWQDEFNYEGRPDPKKWNIRLSSQGAINNEWQEYVDDVRNVEVKNGLLHITAIKEGNRITSGRIDTKDKSSWKYGKFEARIRLPQGRGIWPAFWMMPSESKFGNWPQSGEIDIMEFVGYQPNIVHGTIHCKAYNHVIKTQKGKQMKVKGISDGFHLYTCEWTPKKIEISVDGIRYFSFENDGKNDPSTWPFDHPFYMIFNVAAGGDWGGKEGVDHSIFPQQMQVDYVRVYHKKRNVKRIEI